MTYKGAATHAMFKYIAELTYHRAFEWFEQNPNEPYCYWAKDRFIAISEKDDKELLTKYPEIIDINDHTIVQVNKDTKQVVFSRFCPNLRLGIADILAEGKNHFEYDIYQWDIAPDPERPGNYVIIFSSH